MTAQPSTDYKPDIAIHPGESLLEAMIFAGLTQKEIAQRIDITEKHLSNIVNGNAAITPDVAIKLERSLGISASFWNNLQKEYEQTIAYNEAKVRLKEEIGWLGSFDCYADLVRFGFVQATDDIEGKAEQLLRFFGIDSFKNLELLNTTKFRASKTKEVNLKSIYAWLRCGEILSRNKKTEEFDPSKIKELIPKFRELTLKDDFSDTLVELCSKAGIALVLLPYFKSSNIDGAFRWVANKPLIQLNDRNSYIDIFWFSFFHELGHALLHSKKKQYVDLDFKKESSESEDEIEASKFASNILIPESDYLNFRASADFSERSLSAFSKELGISKAIVQGRLAHDSLISWTSINNRPKITIT